MGAITTISFHCPNCGQICGFKSIHAGRRARCTKCSQRFIIPSSDNGKVEKVKLEQPETDGPISGFYEAMWSVPKEITNPNNSPDICTLVLLVVLFFFFRHINFVMPVFFAVTGTTANIPIYPGLFLAFINLGFILFSYRQIIYNVAFGIEEMPPAFDSSMYYNAGRIAKGLMTFLVCFVVGAFPVFLAIVGLRFFGIELVWLKFLLCALAMPLFAAALTISASGQDWMYAFRLDYSLRLMIKGTKPFFTAMIVVVPVGLLHVFMFNKGLLFGGPKFILSFGWLVCDIITLLLGIYACRVLGLLCKHYSCYLP